MPKVGSYLYLGIDPGLSGGASVLSTLGAPWNPVGKSFFKFKDATEHEVAEWMRPLRDCNCRAGLEKVHSMPKQGVASSFKFGWSYGFLRGLLVAFQIPFVEPPPQRWQKYMGCMTKGDKNVSKRKAHELWPAYAPQITHAIADSLLIAEWLRRENK